MNWCTGALRFGSCAALLLMASVGRAQAPACPPEWTCEALPADEEAPEEEELLPSDPDDAERHDVSVVEAPHDHAANDRHDRAMGSNDPPPPSNAIAAGDLAPQIQPRAGRPELLLRATGTVLATQEGSAAGLRGVGVGLRWPRMPGIAYDLALDALAGTDASQRGRREAVISGGVYSDASPQRSMALGLLAGAALSVARVERAGDMAHIGAYVGAGVRFRPRPDVSFSVQLLGVLRRRIASDNPRPEFVDPATGLATNTSAAGLIRLSAAFPM